MLAFHLTIIIPLIIIKGGLQSNVVPSELRALFDCRLAIDVDHDAFEEMVSYEIIYLKWLIQAIQIKLFLSRLFVYSMMFYL